MIPPTFDYIAPKTLSEAVAALGGNENAKILAGGQSLIPLMRFRLASPAMLVDLNRVEGLSYINESDGWLKIGAMTRESDLEYSALVSGKIFPARRCGQSDLRPSRPQYGNCWRESGER
jgi:carbon-monoxide dehydrogenase medium subunit